MQIRFVMAAVNGKPSMSPDQIYKVVNSIYRYNNSRKLTTMWLNIRFQMEIFRLPGSLVASFLPGKSKLVFLNYPSSHARRIKMVSVILLPFWHTFGHVGYCITVTFSFCLTLEITSTQRRLIGMEQGLLV